MSNLVFPALSGMDIKVKRTPVWSTEVLTAESGKEQRAQWWSSPRYRFVVVYNFLRQDKNGDEFAAVEGFFHRHRGQFDSFLFTDPKDSSVTGMPFGVGNGTATAFQLQRTSARASDLADPTLRTYWPGNGDAYEPIYFLNGTPSIYRTDWQGTQLLYPTARTNLLTYSDAFDNAAWPKVIGGTGTYPVVTINAAQGADGTSSADRIQFNRGAGSTSADYNVISRTLTGVVGQTYGASVWLRSNTGANQLVMIYWVGLSGGSIGNMVTVTPQWQRFSLGAAAIATTIGIQFGTRGSSGDASLDLLVWGAQLEVGGVTSYIPTTTTAVTVTDYTVSNGLVTFAVAPVNGAVLTWTGSYFYRVRFEQDELDFEREFSRVWNAKTVKLITVK